MRLRLFLECVPVLGIAIAHGLAATPDLRLIRAIKSHDDASARTLIGQHADVNAQQGDGATALHWAAYNDNLSDGGCIDSRWSARRYG